MKREDSHWWREGFTKEWWTALNDAGRIAFLDLLDDRQIEEFYNDWRIWGRDKQLAPEGNWSEWLMLAGRGFGKLICKETPISTPLGWRKLGDLAVGDQVFDEAGRPCNIVKTFDAVPDVAYRLHFSDGTWIDACGDHQWVTWTHRDRKQYLRRNPGATRFPAEWPAYRQGNGNGAPPSGPAIRTTQQIVDTFTQGGRGDLNHSIPVTGDLQYPVRDLPLAPWLLGYWLGNGMSTGSAIACHPDDVAEARRRFGAFPTSLRTNGRDFNVRELRPLLRRMGLVQNKHVPRLYLEASIEQRRQLLAGLLDSDGYCDSSSGHVEFCSTLRVLADDVVELARSLGQKPILAVGRAMLNGQDYGPKYRVTWRPTFNPFSLPRKAAAFLEPAAQALRNQHRMIVRYERIDPKPMRCLTVDGPNSMFLCGEGMIPTHNTMTAVKNIIQWIEDGWCRRIAIVGQGEGDIRSVMITGKSGFIAQSPSWNKPDFRPSVGVGELHWPNGAIGQVYSAEDPEALRGPEFDAGWFDEPMAVPAKKREEAYSNLEYGLRLGLNPKLIITTTPKPHKWLKEKVAECKRQEHLPLADREFILTQGSTFENEANLAPSYIKKIKRNEGTRRGRQEIYAEILNEDEGALWTMESLDRCRMKGVPQDPRERRDFIANLRETMERIVIGVDPNTTEGKTTHAAGIVVVGKRGGKHFVFHDGSLVGAKPIRWGERIISLADEYGAHEIVAETNQGGDMIKGVCEQAASNLELPMPKFRKEHTRKSKARRAEPVATAYERLEVFHVGHKGSEAAEGPFYKLEEQMETVHEGHDGTGEDFDRCDALCYAISRLGVKKSAPTGVSTGGGGFMSFGDFANGASN